jgi:hypothetical protein
VALGHCTYAPTGFTMSFRLSARNQRVTEMILVNLIFQSCSKICWHIGCKITILRNFVMSNIHVPLECDSLNSCWIGICFEERHRKKLNIHSSSSTLFCIAVLYIIKNQAEKMLHSCYDVYVYFVSWLLESFSSIKTLKLLWFDTVQPPLRQHCLLPCLWMWIHVLIVIMVAGITLKHIVP